MPDKGIGAIERQTAAPEGLAWLDLHTELRKCTSRGLQRIRQLQPKLMDFSALDCLALAMLMTAPDGAANPSELSRRTGVSAERYDQGN